MERETNIERIIRTLKDEDELVQKQASELLEEIGEPAVEPLITAMNDGNKNIRKGAAHVLGIIGDKRAVDVLIASLKDPNKWVRREVSGALGNLGDPAVDPLIETLSDEDWRARGGAAWALGKIENKKLWNLL